MMKLPAKGKGKPSLDYYDNRVWTTKGTTR